ncbi:MAG TPA: hypothetical protein VMV72_14300 [Verrucomicrobiae bacterium]|nr:hypothetical protein [Verrucomicrobiae bacterium]
MKWDSLGRVAYKLWLIVAACAACGLLSPVDVSAQAISAAWCDYARDAQHSAVSAVPSDPLGYIRWQTPVDLDPQYSGDELLIHYGSPLITASNTVLVPVKTGASGGFRIEAHAGTNGTLMWMQSTDYVLPPHNWTPSFSGTLTPKSRLCFPGGGGTVYYCDTPDTNGSPVIGQVAFYGLTNYTANTNAYLANVFIDTPITSDTNGTIFFGFQVTGSTPLSLTSGVARIDSNGTGIWISARAAANDSGIIKVAQNCAPALSADGNTLYIAVNSGNGDFGNYGYLLALNSTTLAPLAKVRLKDVLSPSNDASVPDDGTASPTIGTDGDVYYGVLENPAGENHYRGWLLHFDSSLTTNKTPGAFGWDDTASIVSTSLVASYHGSSSYLLMTKYNNYADAGGNGSNKIAVLDPNATEIDPVSGATVMNEVLTVLGPTPNPPLAGVREWCINSAAVDPFTKSILANNEDGNLYRWDLTSNTLTQAVTLTSGIGEAYTPTLIGVDGTVYAVNNATLYAIGPAVVSISATTSNAYKFGGIPGLFTVSRLGSTSDDLTVNCAITGAASNGVDYSFIANAVTIPAGSSSAAITISPIDDGIVVGDVAATLTLSNSAAYSVGSPASATVIVYDTPFNDWRLTEFGTNANNAAISGDSADPNGDGIVNVLEYALGLNPNASSVQGLPTVQIDPGCNCLSLTYTKVLSAIDLTYAAEGANNPGGAWSTNGITSTLIQSNSLTETIQAFDTANPVSTASARFMHLRVTRQP